MITAATPTLGQAPLWYVTRSTGITAFVLLTLAMALGVAATQRALASPAWPRFATQALHRNVSLLAPAFLAVHIVTAIADGYVDMGWWSAVVPGASSYRTLWVGLGTVAVDLTLAVILTSLVRLRMGARRWRVVHLTAYALWPLSLVHYLKTGTDAGGRLGIWLAAGSAGLVAAAGAVRIVTSQVPPQPVRSIR